ncbi:MAG: 4-alpha-glucanotransferase [Phycisphaerae bacterium]|nr:4-alpha-glucanotransferase [Phycisphaerae bacterium]
MASSSPNRKAFDRRTAGVLMHITSLAGPHGNGDLGPEAHRFVEFLSAGGQRWWQTLPVGPPETHGFSPYSAQSASAGSPWLVSLELLHREGLLPSADPFPDSDTPITDLKAAAQRRDQALRLAFKNFNERNREHADFANFCIRHRKWLDDWALFAALKKRFDDRPWLQWDQPLRLRDLAAIERAKSELSEEIDFHRFVQYQFERQWQALREAAARKGVGLIGDVPIFVAADSCDVWANPSLFRLKKSGEPRAVSGCPPDMFSSEGQFWRHPQYRWRMHRRTKFAWWVDRFVTELTRFDALRIDHFLGFYRTWSIPANASSAREGRWTMTPGEALLDAIQKTTGPVPVIAEDLGVVTPGAARLREQFKFPGMRVYQFGFDDPYHLPHRYVERTVAYPGTHDNNTTRGWFESLEKHKKDRITAYLGCEQKEVPHAMIRSLYTSVAHTVIVPIQDVLGLGGEARMNVPGSPERNWRWRLTSGQLNDSIARNLKESMELYERLPDSVGTSP